MRLSSLVVASILLAPPALLAQHSSAGGSSSGGASGHSGGSSSGGSSSAASHTSSSAGASHNSSSSHSSSVPGPSAGGHASAGSGSPTAHSTTSSSHNSNPGTTESHASVSSSHSGAASSPSNATRTIPEPAIIRAPTKEKESPATKTAQPEKRGFLSFLRHPFRKPEPKRKREPEAAPVEADLRANCKHKPCSVCPPGLSAGKNGICGTPSPTMASARCRLGTVWNGAACASTTDDCAVFSSRAATLASELRGINGEMQMACSNGPSTQQCGELTLRHDGAVSRYRMLLNEAPGACRTLLPDPLSL